MRPALLLATAIVSLSSCKGSSGGASAGAPSVVITTSMGRIRVELSPDKAPLSVENFLSYVDKSFYDGTIFHRVIGTFMIQGGGFDADLKPKATSAPIKNESANGLKNDRGTIAMARTNLPNSATSQFFINVVDNGMLNYPTNNGYAVFGHVTEGMDVVDRIKAVQTGSKNGMSDVPVTPIVIQSIRRAP